MIVRYSLLKIEKVLYKNQTNRGNSIMKCFRSTSINTIERVYTEGIVPSCGRNSRLIGDNRKKCFFQKVFMVQLHF